MPMWNVRILFMWLEENPRVLNPVFFPCEAVLNGQLELLGLRVIGTIMTEDGRCLRME